MSGFAFSNSVFNSVNTLSKIKPRGYCTSRLILLCASAALGSKRQAAMTASRNDRNIRFSWTFDFPTNSRLHAGERDPLDEPALREQERNDERRNRDRRRRHQRPIAGTLIVEPEKRNPQGWRVKWLVANYEQWPEIIDPVGYHQKGAGRHACRQRGRKHH